MVKNAVIGRKYNVRTEWLQSNKDEAEWETLSREEQKKWIDQNVSLSSPRRSTKRQKPNDEEELNSVPPTAHAQYLNDINAWEESMMILDFAVMVKRFRYFLILCVIFRLCHFDEYIFLFSQQSAGEKNRGILDRKTRAPH